LPGDDTGRDLGGEQVIVAAKQEQRPRAQVGDRKQKVVTFTADRKGRGADSGLTRREPSLIQNKPGIPLPSRPQDWSH